MISLINFFLVLHLLAVLAGSGALLIRYLGHTKKLSLNPFSELKLNYLLVALCFLLPFLIQFSREEFKLEPIVKVVAARDYHDFDSHWSVSGISSVFSLPQGKAFISADQIFRAFTFFVAISFFWGLGQLLFDLFRLSRILRKSFVFKKIGRIRLATSEEIQGPFSSRLKSFWVVIPTEYLSEPFKMKISVLHEIQHHRQRDTSWIYVLFILRSALFLNPVMRIWGRSISEVQELACDKNLVDQGRVNLREYARSLIEIAENTIQRKEQLVCAAGLAFLNDRQTLSRRIESMFQVTKKGNVLAKVLGLGLVLTLASAAFASRSLVGDRRISMSEAQRMLTVAKADGDFPLVLNDFVLKQLNRYLGTEQGRIFIRESLQRMQSYQGVLDQRFAQYHMPEEIRGVALAESGYQNKPQAANKEWGAGIWMFIEPTARVFGLKVNAQVDERLDVSAETDAAMRYLGANHLRFNDWALAIMAYNMGEQSLQKAMDTLGTRDPWVLIRAGYEGDKDYLAKVMAAILILKNPESLN